MTNDDPRASKNNRKSLAVAQIDFVLRRAQHEQKKNIISKAITFAWSLSKGERGLGNSPFTFGIRYVRKSQARVLICLRPETVTAAANDAAGTVLSPATP